MEVGVSAPLTRDMRREPPQERPGTGHLLRGLGSTVRMRGTLKERVYRGVSEGPVHVGDWVLTGGFTID